MSPRKTSARPHNGANLTQRKSARSSLIVKDQSRSRPARDTSALDNRFHRTPRRSPARPARDTLASYENGGAGLVRCSG